MATTATRPRSPYTQRATAPATTISEKANVIPDGFTVDDTNTDIGVSANVNPTTGQRPRSGRINNAPAHASSEQHTTAIHSRITYAPPKPLTKNAGTAAIAWNNGG